jgi:hypothetical protein
MASDSTIKGLNEAFKRLYSDDKLEERTRYWANMITKYPISNARFYVGDMEWKEPEKEPEVTENEFGPVIA